MIVYRVAINATGLVKNGLKKVYVIGIGHKKDAVLQNRLEK